MSGGSSYFATILSLKFKDLYDFDISYAWLVRDKGMGGVVFRMRDEYNYYYFGLSTE